MKRIFNHLLCLLLMAGIFSPTSIVYGQSGIPEYLHANSFCEGAIPFFFPDPPVLQLPCVDDECGFTLVDVRGTWEPVDLSLIHI